MTNPAPRLRTAVRALRALMLALLAVYVILLTPPLGRLQGHWSAPRDLGLVTAALVLVVVLMVMRAVLVPDERVAWACLAAAVGCW